MQIHRVRYEEMPQRDVLRDQVRRGARAGPQARRQLQLLQPQPQTRAASQSQSYRTRAQTAQMQMPGLSDRKAIY